MTEWDPAAAAAGNFNS